ncbi:MAG TPA: hypothetical protein VJ719_11035, partial [Chthoniobacterales bacterium]|nr:hypothetical protein [Chthoniobacterales bacterium]
FAVLIGFAIALKRSIGAASPSRTAAWSAGGLIAYVLCMNFASTDWVMSLNPEWYSTIFVEVFAVGQFLSALALVTFLLGLIGVHRSLGHTIPVKALHDLGNMLLAFVIFWTYLAFAQFLIIWSGNLPKEISWYLQRSHGGWEWFAAALAVLAFLIPFWLLLSRSAKQQPRRLGTIALLIVIANVLIDFWFIAPSFHPDGFRVHWLDLTQLIAIGACWSAFFLHFVKQRPLLPVEWTEVPQHV